MSLLVKRKLTKKERNSYRDFAKEYNNKLALGMMVCIILSVALCISFLYFMTINMFFIMVVACFFMGVFLYLLSFVLPAEAPKYSVRGVLKSKRHLIDSKARYLVVDVNGKQILARTSKQVYEDSIKGDKVTVFSYKDVLYGFITF